VYLIIGAVTPPPSIPSWHPVLAYHMQDGYYSVGSLIRILNKDKILSCTWKLAEWLWGPPRK